MIQLLIDSPLLLLFTVVAIGYPLGRIKIGGSRLGVASVLFVGIVVSSLHPDLRLPEVIYLLGLLLFVYTIGLSSGPGFFASFRRKGLRDNLFILGMILLATALSVIASLVIGLKPASTAGMFTGSLANTPALASVLDYLARRPPGALPAQEAVDPALAETIIAYSLTYPMGVMG